MKNVIGIDLGGTTIKYALVNEKGETCFEGITPSRANESAQHIINQLEFAIKETLDFANNNNLKVEGLGIGSPGIIDNKTGTILGGADNLKGWENIPLSNILHKMTSLPIYLDNDANVMGLAEKTFGAAKECSDVVFLTIGTGIGGAIVINSKLYGGFENRGGELGHFPLIANGESCNCGSVGCFEHYASASALIRRYKERLILNGKMIPDNVNGKYIVEQYLAGEDEAKASFEENCNFIGHAIAGFINIFSPQKVVIGGGLADAGSIYLDKIRISTQNHAMKDCALNTKIELATLGNKAGYLGAAGLVFSALDIIK